MRKIKEIDLKTANYVLLLGISRLLRMIFWIYEYLIGEHFVSLIVADLLHCILLIDFVYCYFKSSKGGAIIVN